jgi:hypothetical protein
LTAPLSGSGAVDLQAAEEEKHEENDQYQAESATESSSTMAPVPVISTSAAEQHDHQENDQNCTHFPTFLVTKLFGSTMNNRLRVGPELKAGASFNASAINF